MNCDECDKPISEDDKVLTCPFCKVTLCTQECKDKHDKRYGGSVDFEDEDLDNIKPK